MEEMTMNNVEMEETVVETVEPEVIETESTEVIYEEYDAEPIEPIDTVENQEGGSNGLLIGLAVAGGTALVAGGCVLARKVIAPAAGRGIRALGRKMSNCKVGKKGEAERNLKKMAKKAKKEQERLEAEENVETVDAEVIK